MSLLTAFVTAMRRDPWIFFGSIFLTIGVAAILAAGVQTVGELRYRRDGVTVEGTVLAKALRPDPNRKRSPYEVRYRFATRDGQEIEGRTYVGLEQGEALRERDPVRVEYLPYAPASNRLAGQGGFGEPVVLVFFGPVFGAIGGLMFRKVYRRLKVERRLLRTGVTAEATVTGVTTGDIVINRQPTWVLTYRYTDRAGRAHEGRSGYMSAAEARAWTSGDTVKIRFDPQNPADSMWIGKS